MKILITLLLVCFTYSFLSLDNISAGEAGLKFHKKPKKNTKVTAIVLGTLGGALVLFILYIWWSSRKRNKSKNTKETGGVDLQEALQVDKEQKMERQKSFNTLSSNSVIDTTISASAVAAMNAKTATVPASLPKQKLSISSSPPVVYQEKDTKSQIIPLNKTLRTGNIRHSASI